MKQTYYEISKINEILCLTVNENYLFKDIGLIGEISDISIRKDYVYIDIIEKKETKTYRFVCVVYANRVGRDKIALLTNKNILLGKLIRAEGSLQYYSGRINLTVSNFIIEDSEGEYKKKIELLQKKYESLGYFDVSRKKPIPTILTNVALITASQGAAINDILNNMNNKYCNITLFDTKVQGIGADKLIADTIKRADNGSYDAILLVRGGGSTQDLRTFDSELIVEAIYQAKTPIVTAIGHDKDIFLVDFVADLTKATPSVVAKDVIKSDKQIDELFLNLRKKISDKVLEKLLSYALVLKEVGIKLESLSIENKLNNKKNTLSIINMKLNVIMDAIISDNKFYLMDLGEMLDKYTPKNNINYYKNQFLAIKSMLNEKVVFNINNARQKLIYLTNEIKKNSPLCNMENGNFVSIRDGQLIKDSSKLNIGDEFELYSNKEILTVVVKQKRKNNTI